MVLHMRNRALIIIEIFYFSIIFSGFSISEETFSSCLRIGVIKDQGRIRSGHTEIRADGIPTSPNSTSLRKHYKIFEETDRYFETIDKQQALDNYNNREFVRKQIFVKPDCSEETKKLVYAITAGDYRTADSIKEKADLNYKDKCGNSVLLCHTNQGIGANLPKQLAWFINNGIDIGPIVYQGEEGELQPDGTFKTWKKYELFSERLIYDSRALSVLIRMRAARSADLEILEILLANNANIEAKDNNGHTPLVLS